MPQPNPLSRKPHLIGPSYKLDTYTSHTTSILAPHIIPIIYN